MTLPTGQAEVWFLTGSQALYGPETLRQVAEQSAAHRRALDANPEVAARVVWKPVLTTARRHPRGAAGQPTRRRAWWA